MFEIRKTRRKGAGHNKYKQNFGEGTSEQVTRLQAVKVTPRQQEDGGKIRRLRSAGVLVQTVVRVLVANSSGCVCVGTRSAIGEAAATEV